MLGHKTSLNKSEFEIIQSIFSDHNGMNPEINSRKNCKIQKYVKINQYTLKQPVDYKEISSEITEYFQTNEYENTTF